MLSRKSSILLLLSIFFCLSAHAAKELSAKDVLNKTASVLANKTGASADFSIKNTKMGTSSGTIYIKGNKFMAKIPAGIVWYDGATQWTYIKANEEVNVTTPTPAQQQNINPYTFIYLYKKGYTYSMVQNENTYSVTLLGKDKSKGIGEMVIVISKKTFVPSLIRMRQGNSWTNITISNFKRAKLNDSMFRFNSKDYPKTEIIDLR